MDSLRFLGQLHEVLQPRCYLEIGVSLGYSLTLARCRTVAIDPAFQINQELHAEIHLFRTTSDEYFSRPDPLAPVDGQPFELTYIDGLHVFECALRDFINVERYSSPTGVVVLDDMLPRNVPEAARDRVTGAWTGDVYSILPVLERYRPDLLTILVDTGPTGSQLILGLDPDNTVLSDNYDQIVAEYRRPDPQPVPVEVLHRSIAQPPTRVLRSGILDLLVEAGSTAVYARHPSPELLAGLRDRASEWFGPAYAS